MLKTSWLALALPFLLLAACDGGDGNTRSTAEIKAEWGQHCDTFATCPDGRSAESCKADFTCFEAALRADMLDKMVACQSARTCDTNDDSCFSLAAQGLTPSAAASSYQTDCLAKRTTCSTAGTTFSDDFCYTGTIMQDDTIASLSTCLSSACADVATCFNTTLGAVAPGCN